MNIKTKLLPLLVATVSLAAAGCDSASESPWSPDGGASSSNIIASNKFTIASSDIEPGWIKVAYGDGTSAGVDEIEYIISRVIGDSVDISIHAADRAGLKTSGGTVYFRSNYGSIEPSCTLTEGSCSVQLTGMGTLPPITTSQTGKEYIAANIVAYTIGEESFFDTNGNGIFDDGDIFIHDMDEPYIDNNNNQQFDANIDEPIDIDGNGTYTGVDGLYSGDNCQHSTLCSGDNRITIWTNMQLNLVTE